MAAILDVAMFSAYDGRVAYNSLAFLAACGVVLAVTYAPRAVACSCPAPGDPIEGAEYALLGTVSEEDPVPASITCEDDTYSGYLYTIHVDEWFIGDGDADIEVFSTANNADCGFHLPEGEQWVLFPSSPCDAEYYVGLCSGNARADESAELLERLRSLDDDAGTLAEPDAGSGEEADGGVEDGGSELPQCIDYCGGAPWYYPFCYCSSATVRRSAMPGELMVLALLVFLSTRRRRTG